MGKESVATTTDAGSASLIGREAELGALRDAAREVAEGSTRAIFVTGEAGLGKTALLRAVEEEALADGFVVAWGHCWESVDTPPFWAWAQALRTLHPSADWTDVAPWVAAELSPLISGEPPESATEDDPGAADARFVLFRAVSALLHQTAQGHPLMIAIEDLHAADEPSLLLLRFLVEEHRSDRILIIATFDALSARQRTRQASLLDEIGRKVHRIPIQPLSEIEVGLLFDRVSGEEPSAPIRSVVYEVTEGNPFFVEETARLLSSKGTLNRPDHSRGFRVPEGARGLVRARLMSLAEESQEILGVAAVLGRQFEVDVLAEVTELPPDVVLDLLHEPEAAGIVDESGVRTYRFTHVLLRETAYEELKAAKRMRLHRRVAEVLEERHQGEEENHYQELAHHWFKAAQGGDLEKTIHFAEAAAEQALGQQAYEEAERLYQRALKASESLRSARDLRERLKRGVEAAQNKVSGAPPHPPDKSAGRGTFKREGEFWRVEFGGASSVLKDSKGLGYVAELLRNPGREIHSLELAGPGSKPQEGRRPDRDDALLSDAFGDLGPVLDPSAKQAYRSRLHELDGEIAEAIDYNDPAKADRAQRERDALVQQLVGAVGLGGRDRKTASGSERARISVTKNIKDAVKRVSDSVPTLGEHLRATLRTGTYCSYTPDPRVPIEWTTT